jgi:hypothetical protein
MLIAVPSKGRPGKVKTLKVIPSATVFVPENEVSAYRDFYPTAKIQGVPTSVSGITKTRNWILENADDDSVVMIDDDVKVCGWVELQEEKSRHKKLEEKVWLAECKKLFEITRQMKYRLWGIATQSAPRSVYPYKPFLFRSYVTASFCGICNESGIRFDESFRVKEDYELNLRCVKEDGGVVAARYLYWENSHWFDEGGCADYRSLQMENDAIKELQKRYPGQIKKIDRGGVSVSIELQF